MLVEEKLGADEVLRQTHALEHFQKHATGAKMYACSSLQVPFDMMGDALLHPEPKKRSLTARTMSRHSVFPEPP